MGTYLVPLVMISPVNTDNKDEGVNPMSKISSVNKDRISTYYVNRKINNQQVSTVDKLEKINPIQGSMSNSSENFLLFSDMFYGKIRDLKQFYKKFYAHEQALDNALEKFKKNEREEETEDWVSIIVELFNKYNQALDSLKEFEKELGIDHSSKIVDIVRRYRSSLENIGVLLRPGGRLDADPQLIEKKLQENPTHMDFLFYYRQGLLYELNDIFKKIQAKPNQSVFNEKVDQVVKQYTSGHIVDDQS